MAKVIGWVMGDEPLVEQALNERIGTEPSVHAERVVIGGTAERLIPKYDVIFDRISHRVPHYRSFLRAAVLAGVNVVNDPFAVADDKFHALSLAARLGANVPRAVLLPQKGYGHGVDPSRDLGNLEYPLLWDEVGHYAGFPAELRSARTYGPPARPVAHVGDVLGAYDQTWDVPTMLQADVLHVRARFDCVCIGGVDAVLVDVGDTGERAQNERLLGEAKDAALAVSRALGLSLNVVSFALTEDRAWVVDALDPAPRLVPHVLGAEPFDQVMDRLAEHLIKLARRPGRTAQAQVWSPELARI